MCRLRASAGIKQAEPLSNEFGIPTGIGFAARGSQFGFSCESFSVFDSLPLFADRSRRDPEPGLVCVSSGYEGSSFGAPADTAAVQVRGDFDVRSAHTRVALHRRASTPSIAALVSRAPLLLRDGCDGLVVVPVT